MILPALLMSVSTSSTVSPNLSVVTVGGAAFFFYLCEFLQGLPLLNVSALLGGFRPFC